MSQILPTSFRLPVAAFAAVASLTMQTAQAADTASPRDVTLPSGIRLIINSEPSTDLVAVHVFIRSGAEAETAKTCGIGNFVAASLLSGTSNENHDQIQFMINSLGNNVSASWDPDFTEIASLSLASRFEDTSYLISDVLKNAQFNPTEVEDTRKTLLAQFQSQSTDLFSPVYENMRKTLYAGTPRERPLAGDPAVIAKLSPDELTEYYDKNYVPRNIVIAVDGNVPADTIEESFRNNLANFPRADSRKPQHIPAAGPVALDKMVTVKKYIPGLSAEYILAGYLAPGADSTDYPAMEVANALLGGMKTSKLFTVLREKKGLGYEVSSTFPAQVGWGDLSAFIVTSTTPQDSDDKSTNHTDTVRDTLLSSVVQFTATKPSDEDLTRAKNYLIGSYLIDHERLEKRAYYLGYTEIAQNDLGGYKFDTHYADAINAVTAADVQRVAKQYLGPGVVISMLLPGNADTGVISK